MTRPSSFSQYLADELCDKLAAGQSLKAICANDAGLPSERSIYRWLADEANEAFRQQYARAREAQADAIFEEILEIADDGSNDWMSNNEPEDPGYRLNGEHVQRSRLRVDARKWMAGKLAPKKYGDKLIAEHSGDVSVTLNVTRKILDHT